MNAGASIPIELRYAEFLKDKDEDILYYVLSRLTGYSISYLKDSCIIESSLVHDEFMINASPKLIIDIWDAVNLIKVSPLELNNSYIRLPLRRFLDNSI